MLAAGRYVVAVSGGIDSVVLLDKLAKQPGLELIVAHFDHGIRDDSAADAAFVGELAKKYGLAYETEREELGRGASEELARERRYAFLRAVAAKYEARIVTAHHADDIIETIAINLSRGTGWRGLAVLDSDIVRPMLAMTKQEIREYADTHQLDWHEDSTNVSDAYLRNRLRRKISEQLVEDDKRQLWALHARQVELKRAIEQETAALLATGPEYSRYFFTTIDVASADELLSILCKRIFQLSPTRPQRARALLAIKTARAGTTYQLAAGMELVIERAIFRLQAR